jgi:hypothetical protein
MLLRTILAFSLVVTTSLSAIETEDLERLSEALASLRPDSSRDNIEKDVETVIELFPHLTTDQLQSLRTSVEKLPEYLSSWRTAGNVLVLQALLDPESATVQANLFAILDEQFKVRGGKGEISILQPSRALLRTQSPAAGLVAYLARQWRAIRNQETGSIRRQVALIEVFAFGVRNSKDFRAGFYAEIHLIEYSAQLLLHHREADATVISRRGNLLERLQVVEASFEAIFQHAPPLLALPYLRLRKTSALEHTSAERSLLALLESHSSSAFPTAAVADLLEIIASQKSVAHAVLATLARINKILSSEEHQAVRDQIQLLLKQHVRLVLLEQFESGGVDFVTDCIHLLTLHKSKLPAKIRP